MSYVMMTNRITKERMLEELRQRMAEIEAAIMKAGWNFLRKAHRNPIATHHLAHRRLGADAAEQFVFFVGQHGMDYEGRAHNPRMLGA